MELCALINNSGIIEPLAKIANMDMEQWRYCLEVNTTAIVALTQKLVPVLQKNKGCVINVSSGAATIAMQGWSAYCASKAALNMITACIAVEEPNIVTLAIGPGTVDTDIQTVIRDAGEEAMHPAEHAKLKELHATGGLLPPEKPAHAIVKLALRAPIEISGMFYSWDSPEIAKYVE
ncbi:hypothetical protein IW140_002318 [Coemansia sp. RSA 1813]|nr:hypothetical protein IW140_002318 [Coemansia sp. RSA 1813]